MHSDTSLSAINQPRSGLGVCFFSAPLSGADRQRESSCCPCGAAGLLNAWRLDGQRSKAPHLKLGQTKAVVSIQFPFSNHVSMAGHQGLVLGCHLLGPTHFVLVAMGGPQGGVCRPPAPCTPGAQICGPELISASPHCAGPSHQHHSPSPALLHLAQGIQLAGSC